MKGSPGKSPSMQWYFKDWLADKQLQRAKPSSRGIWMNILMYMADCPTDKEGCKEGVLEDMTIREICSLGGCSEQEAWDFLEDALKHGFCEIEMDRSATFSIMSRRMSRDSEKRIKWREQKKKQRAVNDVRPNVRDVSTQSPVVTPTPTPSPTSKEVKKEPAKLPKPDSKKPGHFEHQVGSFFKSILESCQIISKLPKKNGRPFNPFGFTQDFTNQRKHPGAINAALSALSKHWNDIDDPYAYGRSVIKTQNGNFNERDAIQIHEKLKSMKPDDLESITAGIFKEL